MRKKQKQKRKNNCLFVLSLGVQNCTPFFLLQKLKFFCPTSYNVGMVPADHSLYIIGIVINSYLTLYLDSFYCSLQKQNANDMANHLIRPDSFFCCICSIFAITK